MASQAELQQLYGNPSDTGVYSPYGPGAAQAPGASTSGASTSGASDGTDGTATMSPADLARLYGISTDAGGDPSASDGGGFLDRTWQSVKNAFTGGAQTEFNYPNLYAMDTSGMSPWNAGAWKLAGAYMLGATPDQISEIAQQSLPGSSVSKDRFGNPMVSWKGQTYYANAPGFNPVKAAAAGAQMVPAALLSGGVGALADAAGLGGAGLVPTLARMGAQGAGQGALSLTTQSAPQGFGATSGANVGQAVGAAAGGALGEPVARGLGALWQKMWGGHGTLISDLGDAAPSDPVTPDMLTTTGQQLFTRAGYDPSMLTVGQLQALDASKGAAANAIINQPSDAAVVPAARALVQQARFGVPLTLGQRTGDPAQLSLEDRLFRSSASGQGTGAPSVLMQQFRGQQQDALDAAAGSLIPGVGSGTMVPDEASLGQRIMADAMAQKGQLEQATKDAYARFPSLTRVGMMTDDDTPSLTFSSGASNQMLPDLTDIATRRAVYANTPAAQQGYRVMTGLTLQPTEDAAPGALDTAAYRLSQGLAPGDDVQPRPFNLAEAETARRQILGLYDSAANPGDAGIVGDLRDALDHGLDRAQANNLASGDPDALDLLQQARAARTAQGQFLDPESRLASNFMDKITNGEMSGQGVVNMLYGSSQLGSSAGSNAILDHLQSQYADNPAAWDAIRQAAARRMLFGSTETPASMSPTNIQNRVTEALDGNGKEITQRLFSPGELQGFRAFGDTMDTLKASASKYPSGTAQGLQDAFQRMIGGIPVVGRAFNAEASAYRQALAATSGAPLAPTAFRNSDVPLFLFSRGTAPGLGGVAGAAYQGNQPGPGSAGLLGQP